MRVLFFDYMGNVGDGIGGPHVYINQIIAELREHGHEVDFVAAYEDFHKKDINAYDVLLAHPGVKSQREVLELGDRVRLAILKYGFGGLEPLITDNLIPIIPIENLGLLLRFVEGKPLSSA
jgi:hypothetical protein